MLQRAASNAYSWWWASHIRTKQSKWLEQNLQDMEEKVQGVLKILEEEGDSFAKRAEMYYKKRPELISFVEESYRAYRALAERYDHISTELQNANNTIASVFPEQVQFAMDEEDEEASLRLPKKPAEPPKANIPKVPNLPLTDLKSVITAATATKKLQTKKAHKKAAAAITVAKSGLGKPEALAEIDRLQKQILTLQTEKEFVKSSYENGLAKYWDIEKQIEEMQESVFKLQDEFGEGMIIEDDEARSLIAAAALKSCQETLGQLQEKQARSAEEARIESERIKLARGKLKSLKYEFHGDQIGQESLQAKDENAKLKEAEHLQEEVDQTTKDKQELEYSTAKMKHQFESNTSLTVMEMAEKVDELVNMVINLETAVSSQDALVKRLRTETDDLQAYIRTLEDQKATLVNGKNDVSQKLKEMEEKLSRVVDLDTKFESQNNNLQADFTEARCNLNHLSEKVQSMQPDEELEVKDSSMKEEKFQDELQPENGNKELQNVKSDQKLHLGGSAVEAAASLAAGSVLDKAAPVTAGSVLEDAEHLTEVRSLEDTKELKKSQNLGETSYRENATLGEEGISGEAYAAATPENQAEVGSEKAYHAAVTPRNQEEACQNQQNEEADSVPKKTLDLNQKDKDKKVASPETIKTKTEARGEEDEPDWRQLYLNGLEGREKVLLTEYTTTLRNYKEVKKKLNQQDKQSNDNVIQTQKQIKELKTSNAMKDEEIRSLRQKLSLMQKCFSEGKGSDYELASSRQEEQTSDCKEQREESTAAGTPESQGAKREEREDIRVILDNREDISAILDNQPNPTSPIEEKIRMRIDELLEENLEFWFKFSSSFHEIEKFETGVQDLQAEVSKLEEKAKKSDGSNSGRYSLKSDARPIFKHLREIQSELNVWLEKKTLLKDELQSRFSSLCGIQEEIADALKDSAEDDDFRFTSFQAAKFQGEVLNMKQENNKVADQLQAGLDHVTTLQLDVEKTLAKLDEEFGLSGTKKQSSPRLQHSETRNRVPLRSFIFGVKPKRQRQSIFACVTPAMHRKYQGFRSGPLP